MLDFCQINSFCGCLKILGPEQIGFCQGKSTLDHCAILAHFANKYSKKDGPKLFAAFLDLKGAFDSIPRDLLWVKLLKLKLDKRLLYLIRNLYSSTSCQVKLTPFGSLTKKIPINRGVKQGCILAPFLFNLFMNDLAPCLCPKAGHSPKLGISHVPILLYADDAVILSHSQIGLKRLLIQFLDFCEANRLVLNFEKSKIMAFGNVWNPLNWNIRGNVIKQVKTFKYLGIFFHHNANWATHRKYVISSAKTSSLAITRFFYTRGNQYVPAALRVLNAKLSAQLLYGIPIWIQAFNQAVESLQSVFLRKILGIPNCVSYAVLCLETSQRLLETRAWLLTIRFWLRMHFRSNPNSLISLMLAECESSTWLRYIEVKIRTIGISLDSLYLFSEKSAFELIKRRLLDTEFQELSSKARNICSPISLGIPPSPQALALYFYHLTAPQLRRAFTLARTNTLPSAMLYGRFKQIPYSARICPCGQHHIETIVHVFFHCQFYSQFQTKFLNPLLNNSKQYSDELKIQILLSSQNPDVIVPVARFVYLAMREREHILYYSTD